MKKKLVPYLYITPIGLILLVFVIGSVALSIGLSFTKYTILAPPTFTGLHNYERLLTDPKFIKAVKNTILLAVMIVPLQMVLSLLVSVFLMEHRKSVLGRLANFAIFIPVLASNAVTGVVWREMLNGHISVVQATFGLFGIDPSTLIGDANAALGVVAMVAIWKSIGFYATIYLSGLLSISDSYYEAAEVDGANKLSTFFHVTLPLLKPTLILTLFLSIVGSLQYFDLITNLTGGGPNNASTTLVVYAYSVCFGSSNAGYAMAISNVLFLLVLAAALLQSGLLKRDASEI